MTNYSRESVQLLTNDFSAFRWIQCNTERIHPKVEYWVTELLQGCEYEFRVSAENEVGAGDPSPPTKPVFAKDPIGNFNFYLLYLNTSFDAPHCKNSLCCHSETWAACKCGDH